VTALLPLRFFDEHPFVIVEPAAFDLVPALASAHGVAIRHPKMAADDAVLPRLIDLRQSSQDVQLALVEHMDESFLQDVSPKICSALASSRSIEDLVGHLARQSVQRNANGKHYWLRYWDPHVLMHLQWIWPERVWNTLMSPVSQWTSFIDRGVLRWREHDTLPGKVIERSPSGAPAALADVGVLNAALRQVDWALDDIPHLGPAMWRSVLRARSTHGLQHDEDLALFAAQCHRWSIAFVDQPQIKAALTLVGDGETRYTDALAQIPVQRWTSIQAELDRAANTHRREPVQ
jgi:hypothetical protein